jgi:hypothetical protein
MRKKDGVCCQRCAILCKVKEINELGGGVLLVRRTIKFLD